METIRSDQTFYLNGSYFNDTDKEQPCEVLVTDDSDIISKSEDYNIHIVRFAVDTFNSMYFIKGDTSRYITVQVLKEDTGRAGNQVYLPQSSFTSVLSDNQASVSAFLTWWNRQHQVDAPIRLQLSIDGAGRFLLKPTLAALAPDGPRVAGEKYGIKCALSDGMSTLLSSTKLTSFVEFPTTGTHAVNRLLDFLDLVIEEDDLDTIAYVGHIGVLKQIARFITRYSDVPDYLVTATHTRIMAGTDANLRLHDGRWATIWWDDLVLAGNGVRTTPCMFRTYIANLGPGGTDGEYHTNANPGFGHLWIPSGEFATDPRVFSTANNAVLAVDNDLTFGQYRGFTEFLEPDPLEPNQIVITDNAVPVEVGDVLFFNDGIDSVAPNAARFEDTTWADVGANHWENIGMAYAYPIVAVEQDGANRRLTLMIMMHPAHIARMVFRFTAAGLGTPNNILVCHITQKRPPFIPLIRRRIIPDADVTEVDGVTIFKFERAIHIEPGDTVYIERRVPLPYLRKQGPFTVDVVGTDPATLPGTTLTLVSLLHANQTVDYTAATDQLLILSKHRVAWYKEDIRRLKLIMKAPICLNRHTSRWIEGQHEVDTRTLEGNIINLIESHPHFLNNVAYPDTETHLKLPVQATLPAALTRSRYGMLETPTVADVSALPNAPHDIMRDFQGYIDFDRRVFGRHGYEFGFFLLPQTTEIRQLLAAFPDQPISLNFGAMAATPKYQGGYAIICGIHNDQILCYRHDGFERASAQGVIYSGNLTNEYTAKMVYSHHIGLLYASLAKGNQSSLLKQEGHTGGNTLIMLPGDFIQSDIQGAVDKAQHFHSINITSRDIGCVPERSSTPRSLQPILTSYLLPPTVEGVTMNPDGEVNSFSENFFGTVTYNESSQRRYHALRQVPGSLRSFSIAAEAAPRDTRLVPTLLTLAPGEQFSFQIMFVKSW